MPGLILFDLTSFEPIINEAIVTQMKHSGMRERGSYLGYK